MAAFDAYDGQPLALRFCLAIALLYPRPHDMRWKTKPMKRDWKGTATSDVDNVAKPIMDALTGIIWDDDRYICRLLVERYITEATYINGEYRQAPVGAQIRITDAR